jgi:recombination protein RecT
MIDKIFDARAALWESRKRIEALLPAHMPFERFAAMAVRSYAENEDRLKKCRPESFLESVFKAAKYGLELDGILGEAYLVPFKSECQLVPGYKGLLKLALQADGIRNVLCAVVYEADEFDYELGMHVDLRHRPRAESDSEIADNKITHVYVVVWLKNGAAIPFVWPVSKIRRHRDKYSKSYKYAESNGSRDSTWHTAFGKMAVKTVLRDALSSGTIPISTEIVTMLQAEKQAEGEIVPVISAVESDLDRLAENLRGRRIEQQPEPAELTPADEEANREPAAESKVATAPAATKTKAVAQKSEPLSVVDEYRDQIAGCDSQDDVRVLGLAIRKAGSLEDDQRSYLLKLLDSRAQALRYA